MTAGSLHGVRVLDLTRVWAGPLAGRILADLGADVLLIEAPTGRGPAVVPKMAGGGFSFPDGDPGSRPWNRNGVFNKLHRNRRSLALNLKTEAGKELFLRLVAGSDVVMENFSARAMPSLGLDYEVLRRVNERIVYLSMPGFGSSGPYRDWVSYGPSLEPMTGLAALLGYDADEARNTCVALPDATGGVTAALALMLALRRRQVSGNGAWIDLSQQEAATALLGEYFIEQQLTGRAPEVLGNAHMDYAPSGVYRCIGEDDWIHVAARDEAEWGALAAEAGRGWGEDGRFATNLARLEHRAELDAAIEDWTGTLDKHQLMVRLQEAGVPAGAVLAAPELLADPQLAERGYWAELEESEAGRRTYPGTPIRMEAGSPAAHDWTPSPGLGQDNDEVLGELLGLDQETIDDLREQGVIVDAPPV